MSWLPRWYSSSPSSIFSPTASMASTELLRKRRSGGIRLRAVIVLFEQAPGDNVPDPLIVVRVQLEHVAVVGEGAVDVAKLQERARETGPGPHIGACFEKAPEMAGVLFETAWPERQLARFDALARVGTPATSRDRYSFAANGPAQASTSAL